MAKPARKKNQAAFRALITEGRLSPARRVVYATLYNHGPLTQLGTYDHIVTSATTRTPISWSGITGRFSELYCMGLIEKVGHQHNRRGNDAAVWDVTARVDPLPLGQKMGWRWRAQMLSAIARGAAGDLERHGYTREAASIRRRVSRYEP